MSMSSESHKKIGLFIRELRRKRGLTQKTFAQAMQTSQSAIARMEKGNQNLSTTQLLKISDVLHHQVLGLKESVDFQIEGGHNCMEQQLQTLRKTAHLLLCAPHF